MTSRSYSRQPDHIEGDTSPAAEDFKTAFTSAGGQISYRICIKVKGYAVSKPQNS